MKAAQWFATNVCLLLIWANDDKLWISQLKPKRELVTENSLKLNDLSSNRNQINLCST
jgi:hypothetical protein